MNVAFFLSKASHSEWSMHLDKSTYEPLCDVNMVSQSHIFSTHSHVKGSKLSTHQKAQYKSFELLIHRFNIFAIK